MKKIPHNKKSGYDTDGSTFKFIRVNWAYALKDLDLLCESDK